MIPVDDRPILGGCDCEHASHFPDGSPSPSAHGYNAVDAVETLDTEYGTFKVCADCIRRGHMVVRS